MGEMAPLWGFSEQQLGQKLLYTALELEKVKVEGADEARKNKEYVNQLIQLLKCVIRERDEARIHLQKLTTINTDFINPATIPHFPAGGGVSDIFLNPPAAKAANSSITESNSLHSETPHMNYQSPVDSIFDPVTSPEFSNMSFANHNQYYVHDSSVAATFANGSSSFMAMPTVPDRGSLIIDELSKGRVLPQKGKLLDAVRDAGPLLQTMMVAGPLPRWRNPPQMQPFMIPPPAAINVGGVEVLAQKPASSVGLLGPPRQLSSTNYTSDFGNVDLPSPVSSNGCFGLPKRQRFC